MLLTEDFGDAPDTSAGTGVGNYETLLANNGPRHTVVAGLKLGADVDTEANATANVDANGDGLDEDGVLLPMSDLQFTIGTQPTVTLLAKNTTGTAATLYGWIDTNNNGVFDNATERAQIAVPTGTTNGSFTLTFPTVPTGFTGTTYARFRLSTDVAAANSTGAASDGEVEDYAVNITKPTTGVVKSSGSTKIDDNTTNGPVLANQDQFGNSLTRIGDIDGDGVTDLAVGAHQDDTVASNTGAVHILRMNADGSVKATTKIASGTGGGPTLVDGDVFGVSVAAMGDIDGDGIGDIAVGSPGFDLGPVRNGAVYILRLNSDGTVKSGGITQIASGTNGGPSLPVVAQFGRSVASLGDINGDGVGDLAVGAFGEDSYAGAVYVLLMNSDGTASSSTRIASGVNGGPTLASSSRFGISLASLGDIDGDETGDVAIGIRGAVYVARLNTDGTVKSHTLLSNSTLGISASVSPALATAGDLDGNGVTDLLVGSDNDNSVYSLFLHADGTLAGSVRIGDSINGGPSVAGTLFGSSVSSLGDFDGDGVVDILVGARNDNTAGPSKGAAYILRLDAATLDFGDAPDTGSGTGAGNYATTLAEGGPRHIINSGLRLGVAIDAESNATANAAANGDGLDEDGVLFPLTDLQFTIGSQPTVTLRATNTTGTAATLYGWVDYNGNGVFDNATERASVSVPTATTNGSFTLTFPTVPTGFTGKTYARFRLSTDTSASEPTGVAINGEVEDYAATIVAPTNAKPKLNGITKIADNLNGGPSLAHQERFGFAVTRLGDLDGDGIGDIAVGAAFAENPNFRGAVYIHFLNADGTVKATTRIGNGSNGGPSLIPDAKFGSAIANLGDIDGDGVVDLAVGSYDDDAGGLGRGAVYILRLNTNGTVKSGGVSKIGDNLNGGPALANFSKFGSAVANLGDLDGDGINDLAVGAYGDSAEGSFRGAVYILRLNADGSVKTGGTTRIASGVNGGPTLTDQSYFGSSLASLGDFDGDGIVDLAVGTTNDDTGGTNTGAVYLMRLNSDGTVKTGGLTQIASGTNGGPTLAVGDNFGTSVANVGDLDGDGITDLVVGAHGDDTGGSNRGAIYAVRLNADGTVKTNGLTKLAHNLNGGPTLGNSNRFGKSAASLGDFDADGVPDLIVGASLDAGGGTNRGAVYILRMDVPATPTAIGISSSSVAENQLSGTAVGTFSTTDANPFDTFTYTFATGTGDTDNGSFQIVGNELRSNAVFNFEAKSSYSIRVRTTDDGGLQYEQTFTISVTDVNEAPTAMALQNTTTSLAENVSTATAIKLADISVTDDALGTNVLSLSGTDAAFFEIVSNELRLKAGTVLDFEAKSIYNVTVEVNDAAVGGAVDASQAYALTLTDVNEAPTAVTLQNTTTSLAENTSTATAIKLADISVTDDALGTNVLSLSGTDAGFFEIVSNELRLKAGTVLDFEAKSIYNVTVEVNDAAVGGAVDASQAFALTLTDVNEAPTAVTLQNTTTSLAENTSTATAIKLADISVTDDALGTNVLSLSGTDAAFFEIVSNELRLKAGTVLDFEAKSAYNVTVEVNDAAVGGAVDAFVPFTLSLTNVLDTTTSPDAFRIVFSAVDVTITHAINGGTPVTLGPFPLSSPILLNGLEANDSVRVLGTAGPDLFTVSSSGLVVNGTTVTLTGPASRTLFGAAGNDVYQFDADSVLGVWSLDESGGGLDTVDFSLTSTVNVVFNMATAGIQAVHATNLSLVLGSAVTIENVIGGTGDDTLFGNSLNNTVTGGAGNDRLIGAGGDDLLIGGADNDIYVFVPTSAAEADQVTENPNEGIDTLSFAFLTTDVSVDLGLTSIQMVHLNRTVTLSSAVAIENILGGTGADTLNGNSLSNTLSGGAGDDRLNGGAGNDFLFGGANNDTYVFVPSVGPEVDQVTENLNDGTDTLNFSSLTTDVLLNLGSSFVQSVHTDRTLKLNSAGVFENIIGGTGADTLFGNSLKNTISGGAGNDKLIGAGGDDLLMGGADNDTYVFAAASAAEADQVTENPNEGIDTLSFAFMTTDVSVSLGLTSVQTVHLNRTVTLNSAVVIENILGGTGGDTLTGNSLSNTLSGGAGDDRLNGGAGNDFLFGGSNNDTYIFAASSGTEADQLTERTGEGNDTLSFVDLTTDILLNLGSSFVQSVHTDRTLKLNSAAVFENIIGGTGADTLFGNSLNNTISGGAGNDKLIGAGGDDLLIGGANNDTYLFVPSAGPEADEVVENTNEGIDTLLFAYLSTDVTLNLGSTSLQTVHTDRTLKLNSVSTFENAVGGTGNDTLLGNALANRLTGGEGNNILVGLEAGDILEAGSGRDILIGGLGLDILIGGAGDDILIAGLTTSDTSLTNLSTLRTAWISPDAYETRVASLRVGAGSPEVSLKSTINVLNDAGDDDVLVGGTETDWFFRALDDVIADLLTGEVFDVL